MKYILTTEAAENISMAEGNGPILTGLGDSLAYSTLPELLNNNGHEFYLHTTNKYNFADIFRLVWQSNPYVKHIETFDYTYIQIPLIRTIDYKETLQSLDFIENIEMRTGFKSGKSYPQIYHDYKFTAGLYDKILIDLHSMSAKFRYPENMCDIIIDDLISMGYNKDKFVFIDFVRNENAHSFMNGFKYVYYVKDIFEYCDVIKHCEKFVCLHSGSYMLSHAIKSYKNIICYFSKDGYEYHVNLGNFFMLKNSEFRLL